MKFPACLKDKLLLILIPILITSSYSAASAMYQNFDERITENENRSLKNETQLEVNDIPNLKEYIDNRFDKVDNTLSDMQEKDDIQYRLLCKISKGEC